MRIAAIGKAFPPNYYSQESLLEAFREVWAQEVFNMDRLERLHQNVLVGGRHLALPLEEYPPEVWRRYCFEQANVADEVGANEVAEGIVRVAASEAMAERSEELAATGVVLAAEGEAELEVAAAAAGVAGDLAEEAVAEAVVAGAELGAAATLDDVAGALAEAAEE